MQYFQPIKPRNPRSQFLIPLKNIFTNLVIRSLGHTKLYNLNIHPLEVVSRCRDPQIQASKNYSYCVSFETKHLQILMFKHSFNSQLI